LALFSVNLLFI